MSAPREKARSDALVFFGATGDLAYKKIFPALHAMAKRGHLEIPVIGVARPGFTLEQLVARARESVEKHGGVDFLLLGIGCGFIEDARQRGQVLDENWN